MIFLLCLTLHDIHFFYSINLIFYFLILNILIYTCLLIFQVLFLDVINDYLFIY